MNTLLRWLAYALAIILISYIIPGIEVSGFGSALIAIIIIGLVNAFIRPIVDFITLPINILTLGLFSLIINALLLMLAGYLSPGFEVEGFWSAFFGAILLAILSVPINMIGGKRD